MHSRCKWYTLDHNELASHRALGGTGGWLEGWDGPCCGDSWPSKIFSCAGHKDLMILWIDDKAEWCTTVRSVSPKGTLPI